VSQIVIYSYKMVPYLHVREKIVCPSIQLALTLSGLSVSECSILVELDFNLVAYTVSHKFR